MRRCRSNTSGERDERGGQGLEQGGLVSCKIVLTTNSYLTFPRFKLRLRPPSVLSQLKDVKVPELPAGKNIVQVYADFFGYLMACTEKYIKDTYAAMTGHVWNTLRYDMILVLAHPNGWEGAQQQQMRRSAILANIIPNTPRGRDRVVFVTEGEASLHFCVKGQFIDDVC